VRFVLLAISHNLGQWNASHVNPELGRIKTHLLVPFVTRDITKLPRVSLAVSHVLLEIMDQLLASTPVHLVQRANMPILPAYQYV